MNEAHSRLTFASFKGFIIAWYQKQLCYSATMLLIIQSWYLFICQRQKYIGIIYKLICHFKLQSVFNLAVARGFIFLIPLDVFLIQSVCKYFVQSANVYTEFYLHKNMTDSWYHVYSNHNWIYLCICWRMCILILYSDNIKI